MRLAAALVLLIFAIMATDAPATRTAFSLEELMKAPVGRVDAFGVGVTAEDEEAAAEAAQ